MVNPTMEDITGLSMGQRRRTWIFRSKTTAGTLTTVWRNGRRTMQAAQETENVNPGKGSSISLVEPNKEKLKKFDLSSTAPINSVPRREPKTDLPASVMRTLPERKRIALVAHDKRKGNLLEWTQKWQEVLRGHELLGTGTTSLWLREQVGLEVEGLLSGPFGGDQQIGARIAEQRLDMLVFFWDPFDVMPHDSDVKALLRIATLYDVPIANNPVTADFLISSPLMSQSVECQLPDTKQWLTSRKPTS